MRTVTRTLAGKAYTCDKTRKVKCRCQTSQGPPIVRNGADNNTGNML